MATSREETISLYSKPCISCRKRKVKCDKTRPCSNCHRSKQLCTYDLETSSSTMINQDVLPSSTSDVRERLARLEELVATMMLREDISLADSQGSTTSTTEGSHKQIPATSKDSVPLLFQSKNVPGIAPASALPPVGQIIFQEGYSAYFHTDFWPGLINEIEDLRIILQPPAHSPPPPSLIPSLLLHPPSPNLTLFHPSIEQSNLLLKFFFQSVNPFIHVIHESNFRKELDQYRRKVFFLAKEFEALLFSIYALTINSLRPELVETQFFVQKDVLLGRFQEAARVSLGVVSFYKSDKVLTMQALLHYLTLLFQQNTHHEALSLLAITTHLSQQMGYHRSPKHFPYSPWVSELRRRIWNHISCLSALALTSYGSSSSLPASDTEPPINANDAEWHSSRFAKATELPRETFKVKDMTFVLVHREIADLTRRVARCDTGDFGGKEGMIAEVEKRSRSTYLRGLEGSDERQGVIVAFVEVKLSSLRLGIRYQQDKALNTDQSSCFIPAINLLEALEYYSSTFAPSNWEWVFDSLIPWLATAIILTKSDLAKCRQEDIERGERQVERVFGMYSGLPVENTPLWQLLVQLRERFRRKSMGEEMRDGGVVPSMDTVVLPGFDDDLMLEFDMTLLQENGMMYEDQFTF